MKMIAAVNTGDQSVSRINLVRNPFNVRRDTLLHCFTEKATKREQKAR